MRSLPQTLEKEIRALTTRHGRKKSDNILIEGVRSISVLIARGIAPEQIVVSSADLSEPGREFVTQLAANKIPLLECDRKRFAQLSETVHSQGLIAVVRRSSFLASSDAWRRIRLAVYLDSVADPGNVGTIIRTCAAFGVSLIALSPGCADIGNPKVLRSTAGTIFAIPVAVDISAETLDSYLRSNQVELIGAAGDAPVDVGAFSPKSKLCIALGAEAVGLSPEILNLCQSKVRVPIEAAVESLNVASAASIAIYEMSRKMKLL